MKRLRLLHLFFWGIPWLALGANSSDSLPPVSPDNPMAEVWNDPEFQKRLLGSYGLKSEVEPRMTPEEQAFYRDKVVPALRGESQQALALIQGAAKPGASAQFDFVLGNLQFQDDDVTNAVQSFNAAITKFPDFLRAQKNLGFALLRLGRYEEAVGPLTRAAELGGSDGKLFGLLGFAHLSLGQNASAESAYKMSLLYEPNNVEFKLGLVKSALALGNYDLALSLLEELLQRYPDRDALWALQANVYIQKEQPLKAALSLELLRRLGRATPAQLLLLGDLYLVQEARDLALAAYLEGIEKGATDTLAKSLRAAEVLAARGDWASSKKLLESIRANAGATWSPQSELKWLKVSARVALGTGETERALQILDEVAEKDPLDGEALIMAGDGYARSGQPEKAQSRYEQAARREGFEADALVKQAQLLVTARKYDAALELLRKAQKVRPKENVQRYLERVEQVARTAGRRS
ncbi:MAG: tetratricopeptide repeat protein [Verrucomicrobia bacterium]|nr:tetratricopeptide repeat protein [Verrucomicrobiota bacterium]